MRPTAPAAGPTDPLLVPRVHEVLEIVDEAPDVVTLRVAPTVGSPPSFLPGQASMVGAFGVGEAAITISSAVEQTEFHDYTIRRAGAITAALTSLRPGDALWARGPFGTPWDLDLARCDIVVAAAGIGIAALRAAVLELVRFRERYGEIVVVVGARDPTRLVYRHQYDGWREHGLTVVETVEVGDDRWERRVSPVPDVVADLVAERSLGRLRGLVCGPDAMMLSTARSLIDAGTRPNDVQLDVWRNMRCGNALCGHCQAGGVIVCRDGPVVPYPAVAEALSVTEY